jgi:hypothetical protein
MACSNAGPPRAGRGPTDGPDVALLNATQALSNSLCKAARK